MLEDHIYSELKTIKTMLIQLVQSQPPLNKRQFAQRAGLSESTLHRKLNRGEIKQRPDGKINYTELLRFNSGMRLS